MTFGERVVLATPFTAGFTLTRLTYDVQDVRDGPEWEWLLRGPAGVVRFRAGRHRAAPGLCEHHALFRSITAVDLDGNCWIGWDLGYHSPRPRYPDQAVQSEQCPVLGGRCYYDGTIMGASELLEEYLAAGQATPLLAQRLREAYDTWLGERGDGYASPATALLQAMRERT